MSEEPRFTTWLPWRDRGQLLGGDRPGVYLLAHFDARPPTSVNPCDAEVIYIGETCQQSLQERLRAFDRSARTGASGHSGGRTYHKSFGVPTNSLYVAVAAAPWDDSVLLPLEIRHLERRLMVEYARVWKRPPACNRK